MLRHQPHVLPRRRGLPARPPSPQGDDAVGVTGGDVDAPPVRQQAGRAGRGDAGRGVRTWRVGWAPVGGRSSPPGPPTPSSEWPREPQVPLYVPKFHSGWEPPLDVLQEAPWEVEGLASAPDDEVRAPTAPHPAPLAICVLHQCSPLQPTSVHCPHHASLPWPSPHAKPRWSFFPTADSSEPTILSKLPKTQPRT